MTDQPNLFRYALIFAGTYAVFLLVANIIVSFLDAEIGTALNMGILMGAVSLTSYKFAYGENRKAERKEKAIIALYCLGAALIISMIAMGVISTINDINIMETIEGLSIFLLTLSMVLVCLLYFVIIYFTFGWLVGIYLKNKK